MLSFSVQVKLFLYREAAKYSRSASFKHEHNCYTVSQKTHQLWNDGIVAQNYKDDIWQKYSKFNGIALAFHVA